MAKSLDIQLVLVRAAATDWDDAGRVQGNTDLPLSERSSATFDALAQGFWTAEIGSPPAAIYAAPDEASVETARLLAASAPVGPVKVKSQASLRAINLGLWQGLLTEEVEQRYPRKFKGWQDDPAAACAPEGEPIIEGQARLLAALSKLADKTASPLIVVLRPLEHAMVSMLLSGEEVASLWRAAEERNAVYAATHARSVFRDLLGTMKAVA